MGKLRSCSLDSDYIFMNPSSEPIMKCTKICLEGSMNTSKQRREVESHYMCPRSIMDDNEGAEINPGLYDMIDMSELYAPPEEPEVTREIVTPPEIKKPPAEKVSSTVFLQNRLNAAKTKKKFVFSTSEVGRENEKKTSLFTNPSQHRRAEEKKLNKKCRSLDDDDVYMEMMGRHTDDHYPGSHHNNQLIDFNDNIRSQQKLYHRSCNTTSRNSYGDPCCTQSEAEDEIYADVADYGYCSNDCHKELKGSSSSPALSNDSSYLPSSHACMSAPRRLPPRPSRDTHNHKTMPNSIEGKPFCKQLSGVPPPLPPANEKHRPSPSCVCPPIMKEPDVQPKVEYDPTFQATVSTSQPKEMGLLNSKFSTIKSKTSSLLGKTLLSKSNLFTKNQKQDKLKQNDGNTSPRISASENNTCPPKQGRKIHPIADMIRKKRNASQPNLMQSTPTLVKSVASTTSKAERSYNDVSTITFRNGNKTDIEPKKKSLTFTNSLPLSDGGKFSVPSQPKVLTTIKSSPSIIATPTQSSQPEREIINRPKTSPKPHRLVPEEKNMSRQDASQSASQNQSFLFSRRGSEIRFDEKRARNKKESEENAQIIRRNMTRANTFDGLSADNLIAESYEVPMYLQQSSSSESPPKSYTPEYPDSDVFVLSLNLQQPSPKLQEIPEMQSQPITTPAKQDDKHAETTIESQVAERRSQFEKLRSSFSQNPASSGSEVKNTRSLTQSNIKPLRFPTRPPPSAPTSLGQNGKDKDPSSRPPPPSLQKIREARLRKNWSNIENTSANENALAYTRSRVSTRESRNQNGERSKHFSNPELLPSPEEDDEYTYIAECSQNYPNSNDDTIKSNKLKLSRNKSMGATASSVTSIKFRFEGIKQHHADVARGGSVESFESDSSLKDEDEGIYEDIVDINDGFQ